MKKKSTRAQNLNKIIEEISAKTNSNESLQNRKLSEGTELSSVGDVVL